MEIKQGIITGVIRKKGYGFIRESERDKELFFTAGAVIEPEFEKLKEGMAVKYFVTEYERGGERREKAIGVVATKSEV